MWAFAFLLTYLPNPGYHIGKPPKDVPVDLLYFKITSLFMQPAGGGGRLCSGVVQDFNRWEFPDPVRVGLSWCRTTEKQVLKCQKAFIKWAEKWVLLSDLMLHVCLALFVVMEAWLSCCLGVCAACFAMIVWFLIDGYMLPAFWWVPFIKYLRYYLCMYVFIY